MKLYTYFRSSAAYRVRIALNLKSLPYTAVPVHLVRGGGEHHRPAYLAVNPQGLIPSLEHESRMLTQSLAILEYLEDAFPRARLLPDTPGGRARVRSMALTIACDIHPLNNLRVLRYLQHELNIDETQRTAWYQRWIREGFTSLEAVLAPSADTGNFCHGDTPTLADCCLVPQVYNALRFRCPMEDYPTVMRIYEHCLSLDAFKAAAPENQPDAE